MPDPEVMNTLFAKFIAIVGPVGILPIIFAVNAVTVGVNFAAATMGAREDFEAAALIDYPPFCAAPGWGKLLAKICPTYAPRVAFGSSCT